METMSAPDYSEIIAIEKRMKTAAQKRHKMAAEVGMAIALKDFIKERKESLLARYAVVHIKADESSAAADTLAKSDPDYIRELNALADVYAQARTVIKEDEAEICSWETARSLLARQRETLNTLPETEA
jgi:hypothetical protein